MDWNAVTRFAEKKFIEIERGIDALPDREERVEAIKQLIMFLTELAEDEEANS